MKGMHHSNTRSSVLFALFIIVNLSLPLALDSSPVCKSWLVQSIPTDMPQLPRIPGVLSTGDVFRWLAHNSTRRLDIIAQYWQLIARPDDPRSGDYGYSKSDMHKFGADEGYQVYEAIKDAADKNVHIRLLSHSGVYPDYTREPASLASGSSNVKNLTLLFEPWWGSGIVHAKVWISDRRHVYIGSANNDWKSLTQVKELGIYLADCPEIAQNVEIYFNNLWKLATLNSSAYTKTVSDQQWQLDRQVPCWSHFVEPKRRCKSPLPQFLDTRDVVGYPFLRDPYMFKVPIQTPAFNHSTNGTEKSYLSFAPPEVKRTDFIVLQEILCRFWYATQFLFPIVMDLVCNIVDRSFYSFPYRFCSVSGKLVISYLLHLSKTRRPLINKTASWTYYDTIVSFRSLLLFCKFQTDEQAWIDTIKSVGLGGTVRISTMDWLGQSQYTKQTVYWSSLSSAISEVVFSKHARVKLLVAYWSHFINNTDQYLKSLLYSNTLCSSSNFNKCSGKVEIKYYLVPGFNLTGPAITKTGNRTANIYPGFSRVNHGKYAVSDVRAHIGTSNLIWDYFYTTAGVSFGTYNPTIVSKVQEVFDVDWSSTYAVLVE